jgi:hypothetical protein
VELDLGTFLVTVYCVVDELYREHCAADKPVRRGKKPELSDSEVLTLAALAQWQAQRSERAFLRYAVAHWRGYFPRLLSQSAFNRRARDVWGALCRIGPLVGRRVRETLGPAGTDRPGDADQPERAYQVVDCVPVALLRRCRGERHKLFTDEAAIGHGGSDDDWYYGVQLLLCVNAAGLITGFVYGPADTDDRWLAEALRRWRRAPLAPQPTPEHLAPVLPKPKNKGGVRKGPSGPVAPRWGAGSPESPPYLVDLGFAGEHRQAHLRRAYGAEVVTKRDFQALLPDHDPEQVAAAHASLRQVVETVNDWLTALLGLSFPKAHTARGLTTRLAAKVAAFNLARLANALHSRPPFAHLNPLELAA